MDTPIKKIKLSNPKTNAKLIESIVPGSIVHFKIPKRKRSNLLAKGYRFTKSPGSKNSFFKAESLGHPPSTWFLGCKAPGVPAAT